jgi:hypothetical protein
VGVALGGVRVTFWGALAIALIAGVGWVFEQLREWGQKGVGGLRAT